MKIGSFGLFWSRDEIDWLPGQGYGGDFRMLGRIGKNRPTIQIADFRKQTGIYILYDDYGPNYVGLARSSAGLGKRLKDHNEDHLRDAWTRFSWFGFQGIGERNSLGITQLRELEAEVTEESHTTIGDLEALLMRALGTMMRENRRTENFKNAEEWIQIDYEDIDHYLEKLA